MEPIKFTTGLSYSHLTDGRVAVDNGIGQYPLGHVAADGAFDGSLAHWISTFPADVGDDFEAGIAGDAALARSVLRPGTSLSLRQSTQWR